jgi:hypothetical protein
MTITELITKLEMLRDQCGDLQVGLMDSEYLNCGPVVSAKLREVNTKYDSPVLSPKFILLDTQG